ncbi:hypothetical protein QAD02_013989 [Eretmocerus hayati]|uniref:Uncharacterized protein n=1 Tax=Eretmocerus hayati TaxID=131215 RepID=A0ACC2P485_9HYME|nr:hypothetical protein QAD02_013989 [Eretmocerus hayati]
MDGEILEIDPLLIFTRMTSAMFTGKGDLETYFLYELCTYPAALFNEKGMIDSKKSRFSDEFPHSNKVPANPCYVIDGGLLLHKVLWKPNQTIRDIITRYVTHVKSHYSGSETFVVFDGYPDDCSTKSYERFHRNKTVGAEIQFNSDTPVKCNQELFLSNEVNKKRFIQMLSRELQMADIKVNVAEEDADLLIIQTAVNVARAKPDENVVVVGEDIDLLVIMNQLAWMLRNLHFLQPKRSNSKRDIRIFSSSSFKHPELQSRVGFLHSFSGCDTTSGFCGHGKSKLTMVMKKNERLRELMNCFYEEDSEKSEIADSACKIVVALYSGESEKNLAQTRFSSYCDSSASKTLNLKELPPTEGAVQQHSYRVYQQLQTWLGRKKKTLEWGWSESHYGLKPCMVTDKKYLIPEDILRDFFCSCRTGCKNNSCGCRKRGLKCSNLCQVCVGKDCSNCEMIADDDGNDSDEGEGTTDDRDGDNYDEIINAVVNDFEPECDIVNVDMSDTMIDRECVNRDEMIHPNNLVDISGNEMNTDVRMHGENENYNIFNGCSKNPPAKAKNIFCTCRSGCKNNNCGRVERGEKCTVLCKRCLKGGCINFYEKDNVRSRSLENSIFGSESTHRNGHMYDCDQRGNEIIGAVVNSDIHANDDFVLNSSETTRSHVRMRCNDKVDKCGALCRVNENTMQNTEEDSCMDIDCHRYELPPEISQIISDDVLSFNSSHYERNCVSLRESHEGMYTAQNDEYNYNCDAMQNDSFWNKTEVYSIPHIDSTTTADDSVNPLHDVRELIDDEPEHV